MQIQLNGEARRIEPATTIATLLDAEGLAATPTICWATATGSRSCMRLAAAKLMR